MPQFNTLDDLDLTGKRVLVRVDLNVPMVDGKISDTTRIERVVPTITDILAAGGTPILLSHFGRPKGVPDPDMSLAKTAPAIAQWCGHPTRFVATNWSDVSTANKSIADAIATPAKGIILLENTRFHPGEEQNDLELAKRMASLGDVYVNDAFSAAHRAHASTAAIAHLLPNAAGRAMQGELEALESGLGDPARPLIAVVGGAKVSTKMDLLDNLIRKVDILVIGGGMANTFLHAQGIDIGNSLCEKDLVKPARRVLDHAGDAVCEIILPTDAVVATQFKANPPHRVTKLDNIAADEMILDVGPATISKILSAIDRSNTLIWNGPVGAFELAPFDVGTMAIAHHAAKRTSSGQLVSVAGGGDTVAALAKAGTKDQFTYVSTAGGAFLEWMEGKTLPGVAALSAR